MKTTYTLDITTITAIHVGNGETLERDFDYVTQAGKTWVVNVDALAAYLFEQDSHRYNLLLKAVPLGKLLEKGDYDPASPIFRYVMPGVPASTHSGASLTAHIKTVHDTAYLPGSSLKGALRTVLARAVWEKEDARLRRTDLGRNRSWAGQKVEGQLLGKDPNHDLLRALQISDTPAVNDALVVHHARVFTGDHVDSPIPLECLRRDVTLSARLTLDEFLLQNSNKLGWQHGDLLRQLPTLANAQATTRITQELNWFQQHQPASRVAKLYSALANMLAKLQANQFLLQVGWGGGYDSKTLTPSFTPPERAAVIKQYNLARDNHAAAFPTSRRTIASNSQPYAPLGWLLVGMQEGRQ